MHVQHMLNLINDKQWNIQGNLNLSMYLSLEVQSEIPIDIQQRLNTGKPQKHTALSRTQGAPASKTRNVDTTVANEHAPRTREDHSMKHLKLWLYYL